jgi:hypothetical protein
VFIAILLANRGGHQRPRSPQEVAALISRIAQNQVNAALRAAFAGRRDSRRTCSLEHSGADQLADRSSEPIEALSQSELLAAVWEKLDEFASRIIAKRSDGRTWEEIASEEPTALSPEAIRKQFTRALRPLVGTFLENK